MKPEEQVARLQKALLDIRAELTGFDPDGDDRDYDREQAVASTLKLIDDVLLPKLPALTGEQLLEIARKLQTENNGYQPAIAWRDMSPKSRELYDAIAAQVNETYIKPLQGRIADLEAQVIDMTETLTYGGERTPVDEHEALQGYARQQLHKEDSKP